jgi:SAM-dependent methyltransferase
MATGDLFRRLVRPFFRARRIGLFAERYFWWRWIRTRGLIWPEEFQDRLDPDRPFSAHLVRYIEALPDPVRVLDVGAGPITSLGYRVPGKQLELTPVDVLAPHYDAMLRRRGVTPPVRTTYADAENMRERFPEASFDLVCAQNSLDHTSNPVAAIQEMVRLAKPDRHVVLVHAVDEAESQKYIGLHQWNLSEKDGQFLVWRPGQTIAVASVLGPECDVRAWREDESLHVDIYKRGAA